MTTGLRSLTDKNMYVFNPVLEVGTVFLIRRSGGTKFQIDGAEWYNENLEMKFDCLARADKDDIDLRIPQHELVDAGESTSQQDNEVRFVRDESDLVLDTVANWQPV